eukprot:scaffold273864_cov31-Tisochrysis_lutea.AAC.1
MPCVASPLPPCIGGMRRARYTFWLPCSEPARLSSPSGPPPRAAPKSPWPWGWSRCSHWQNGCIQYPTVKGRASECDSRRITRPVTPATIDMLPVAE